jgi:hypothetical protein
MEKLKVQLGLSKPKHAFDLHMADQMIAKPLGFFKDIKKIVHGIPYVVTFTVIQSSVLECSYYMLLGRPW